MWEFSIIIDTKQVKIAKYMYTKLKNELKKYSGVVTSFEETEKINLVVGCPDIEKIRTIYFVQELISYVICNFFKEEYIKKHLQISGKNQIEAFTFCKALVNFDRETDRYIVGKFLTLEKSLYLNSFFHFKLKSLKEKWNELIKIANENNAYLFCDDAFLELLRFLVDNIEIASDELYVIVKGGNYYLLNVDYEEIGGTNDNVLDEFQLVNKLLELSPRKINWCSSERNTFLENVFEKRIIFVEENSNFFKIVDNQSKMV